jgi:hypothetical protein
MKVIFFILWGTTILFSTVAVTLNTLNNSAQGENFLYILANTCFLFPGFFYGNYPKCKAYLVVLSCISLMTSDIQCLFMCLLTVHIFSFEKCLLRVLPTFECGYLILILILIPYQMYDKHTSHFVCYYLNMYSTNSFVET